MNELTDTVGTMIVHTRPEGVGYITEVHFDLMELDMSMPSPDWEAAQATHAGTVVKIMGLVAQADQLWSRMQAAREN